MKIIAEKMRMETLENGTIRIFTDDDAVDIVRQLGELQPGTIFTEGNTDFVVLDHNDKGTKVIELLLRPDRMFDEDSPNWAASELRNHLNTSVLQKYQSMFGMDNIIESKTDLTTLDGLNNYGTCQDKIRLLTFEEYRKYQHLFKREEKWEWTCTPWSIKERGWEYSVCVVSPHGYIDNNYCHDCDAVRPLCILKSNILVSVEE